MNELTIIENQIIQDKIYTIRGVQVMLDKGFAELYGTKPTRLREQVRKNIKKFSEDFMLELTESEVDFMMSQNAIPSKLHALGWRHKVELEDGIRTMYEWYLGIQE